ncbi:MAG: hypothetical protein PHD30_08740, partial [Paludibacter sp.]|nr:hypothetical protein [Paludibacter sp.]
MKIKNHKKFCLNKRITIFGMILLVLAGLSAQNVDERGYIVKIGDIAPEFRMKLTDGNIVKLS